jgi:hypothetical protein
MRFLKISAIFMLAILAVSCSKDKTAPVVSITEPATDISVKAGETFALRATVTDDEELASIRLLLGTNVENITQFDTPTSHQVNYSIDIPEGTPTGSITISVVATDKEGNEGSDSRVITVTQ